MVQFIFGILAAVVIWKGSNGFRQRGLQLGFLKDRDKPLDRPAGMIVGAFIIAVGIAMVLFGFLLAPSLFPDL